MWKIIMGELILINLCRTALGVQVFWDTVYGYIKDEGSGVEMYPYPVQEGQRYINLNPGRVFIQQPPQKGKGIERLI